MSTQAVGAAAAGRSVELVRDYVRLTKPRVISLLLVTTACAMLVAARGRPDLLDLVWTLVGGYLSAGGANAINMFVDRDIDARMGRTTGRPVVTGSVGPAHALAFGIALAIISTLVLGLLVNWLASGLAFVGLALYVGLYTLWLKRRTIHNIVIGGAAGAVPPLVGWAAATGELSLAPVLMFAIVFYWTPPHFWALSLLLRRDYGAAGVPMLPVVKGEAETRRQVLIWTLIMIGVTLLPYAAGAAGWIYLASAIALGTWMLKAAIRLVRVADIAAARWAFHLSMLYLALLFVAWVVDAIVL